VSERRMGPRRWIALALERVQAEITGHSRGGMGIYSGGLSSEGYSGGYRDALMDVALLLNGVKPRRRHYYNEPDSGGAHD
jgi:hypothetical protein